MPQTPRQIVLEWTKPVEPPIPLQNAYSSGLPAVAPTGAPPGAAPVQSSGLPVFDARNGDVTRR
jgi:hypothetical protein